MTLQELCKKYDYAESSVIHGFPRVRDSILRTHKVLIVKKGRGKKAEYFEEDKSEEMQIKELEEFLKNNPHAKEYIKEIDK